jgi:hypothetical protein
MPLGRFDNRELRFIDAIETPLGEYTQAPAPHASTGDGTGLPDAVITDVRVLGSYNLTQHDNPKILVPGESDAWWVCTAAKRHIGSPPIWRNSPLPHSVPADVQVFRGGPVYVDEGAGTKQAESILKMLTAVELCTPNFDWNQVDIVVERSSLRQLLRWVGSPASRKQDFRMDMHLAGEKTLVLTRWEQNIVYGPSPGSYGFSYQRHETAPAPDCGMSKFVGHERIITYVSTPRLQCNDVHLIDDYRTSADYPLSFAAKSMLDYPGKHHPPWTTQQKDLRSRTSLHHQVGYLAM